METNVSMAKTTTIRLPLFSLKSQEEEYYPGNMTPPLHTLKASVPFQWEEHPGKPFPTLCKDTYEVDIKGLELPPRLLKTTSSPTTVLEGPYPYKCRSLLESSSFRFLRKRQYDGSVSFSGGSSPDHRGLLAGPMVTNKGLFGSLSWRKRSSDYLSFKSLSEVHRDDDFVEFSSSDGGGCDGGATVKVTDPMSIKRSRFNSLSLAKSNFWATIYGAFKQVIPRRSTK